MSAPGSSTRFRGWDELHALFDVGLIAFLCVTAAVATWSLQAPWAGPALLLALLPAALVAAGARYECRIDPGGIVLRRWRAWIVPVERRRYFTDAHFDLYEAWASDRPEGVYIHSARIHEDDSEPFGPYLSEVRMAALCDRLNRALAAARAAAPPTTARLRCPALTGMHDALDLAHATRSDDGRLRAVTTTAPIVLDRIALPAGSVLRFAGEGFVDPGRADELVEAECSAPVDLRDGLPARAGARLRFDEAGHLRAVQKGFDGPVDIDGVCVDGTETIGLERDRRLCSYTLAVATAMSGWDIPAGSRVNITRHGALLPWVKTVWLGGPLVLPEVSLTSGDSLHFDARDRLVSASPHGDVLVHGQRIRHGIVPIPLRGDGTIDLAACKKAGILP